MSIVLTQRQVEAQRDAWRRRAVFWRWMCAISTSALLATWAVVASAQTTYHGARLVRVIDGDTFDMTLTLYPSITMQQRVRLLGADTPELRGKCERERVLARKARAEAARWFAEHANHADVTVTGVDSFGRALGVIEQDGERLADVLWAAGLASKLNEGEWCDE